MSPRPKRMLDLTPQPCPSSSGVTHPAPSTARRWHAATLLAAAIALLPWMAIVWVDDTSAGNSIWVTLPWEVLDAAEMLSLAVAGYLLWRHDLRAVTPLFTGAVLLIGDGIADMSLAPADSLTWPVMMLLGAELPLAVVCLVALVGLARMRASARTTDVPSAAQTNPRLSPSRRSLVSQAVAKVITHYRGVVMAPPGAIPQQLHV